MATIIDRNRNEYLCTFSPPETEWLRELAEGMGITKEAVLAAAINKGLTYYVETFAEKEVVDKVKNLMTDEIRDGVNHAKDHKEFHKGSCQG